MRLPHAQPLWNPRCQLALVGALATCLFLLILGAKWATFERYGSPMPDWDQWDAEGYYLLIPWLDDNKFLEHLFTPHNEHRVILTKLQNLALTVLNGQWDSRLEAVTNAILHAALGAAFWLAARRWTAARWHAALFVFVAGLFGLPLAWQNVLGGFHSQQYWLLGLSFLALVVWPFARSWSASWWLGAFTATLVMGSMGSGFLAAAVVMVVVGWRLLRRETDLRSTWPTLLLGIGLVAVGLLTRVEVEHHQPLKAKTLHDFIFSALRSMEWPLRDRDWAGAVLWLPWGVVMGHALRRPRKDADLAATVNDSSPHASVPGKRAVPLLAALGGWVLVQIVATAYARGAGADYPASRYMDTLVFGSAVNGIALAWLLSLPRNHRGGHWRSLPRYGLGLAWLALLGIGLYDTAARNFRFELPDARKYYDKAEGHMRAYLATNDPAHFKHPDIPYPSAEGLIERLAHPGLRNLMPVPIRSPLPLAPGRAPLTFAENDALHSDPERPPPFGLSPATPPLETLKSWGSYQENPSQPAEPLIWRSAPINPPPYRWLKFEMAGHVGKSTAAVFLTLEDASTGQILDKVTPSRIPGDHWRAAYVRTPAQPFVVAAKDESAVHWVAFSAPVVMGGGSYWAWRATKHGMLIVYLAGTASLGLAVVAISRRRVGRPA